MTLTGIRFAKAFMNPTVFLVMPRLDYEYSRLNPEWSWLILVVLGWDCGKHMTV